MRRGYVNRCAAASLATALALAAAAAAPAANAQALPPDTVTLSTVNPLSSVVTGQPSYTGSSVIDAASVPFASLSMLSEVPVLAVPSVMLAILGRGIFGSSLYQGIGSSGQTLSSGIVDTTPTHPDLSAPPAEFVDLTHLEGNVYELTVFSPSMQREVANEILLPGGPENTEPRPTLYLMMGADGASGGITWRTATDYEGFFADKLVNVVTPKGSVSSMQADWYDEDPATGINRWSTYMTRELPALVDAMFHGTGRDAIAGVSMSGGPALSIASYAPERYVAAGSFSGCPATTGAIGGAWTSSAVTMNGGNPVKMWGLPGNPAWVEHSPLLNLEALRGVDLFVAASMGVPGPIDGGSPLSSRVQRLGFPMVLEGASYACSAHFVNEARNAGLNVDWYEVPEGTHTWGLFEDELRASWRTIGPALGVE
ncbi:alpha/beta hydrolase [Corynebacterium timonense]|uniref:S-formylglutathione hydrolase FrmB n=1 Tax=Corynebacterium timonense TaxID=441500 RepID=A0A1H1PTR2_9CORY|nr:alpha/beta hydrolase family protein [Corynebacterium timonense]SDS14397.1 S-formylglutathione hydrolase FrmB [Corynebacterium timonense]